MGKTVTSTAEGRWGGQRHPQRRVGEEDSDIYSRGQVGKTVTSTAEGRWGRQRHLQQRVGGEDRDIYRGG